LKVIFFANTDWYLYNFRLDFAKYLREKGWEVVLMAPAGEHTEKLTAAGFRFIPFEFSRKGMNPFIEQRTIQRIKKIYAEEKPDLVHHFTIKCVIYGSLAAKEVGIRAIVNSITGLGYIFLDNKITTKMIRKIVSSLYKKALKDTEVIFENPDDAALFEKYGFTTEGNTHIILGTGIDTELFRPIPPPDSIPLIILPARMLWDKGVGEFVKAAEILKSKSLQARFALVGKKDDGNPSSISYEQLSFWQKEGNVEWWGWQEDILTVISISDIVCLPSYREGLPRILIEAASCGRPIVTTNVPGCREVVVDGVTGFLVPAKDPKSLAYALEKLIRSNEMRIEMGTAARKRAIEFFSISRVNDEIFKIYQQLTQDS
jgi:glycosyltransferase involved in cell wall biosynthesis